MPEFLELLPPGEALARLLAELPRPALAVEILPTASAAGRITARAILSPERLPAFSRSTVDGYALIARSTFGASDALPAYLPVIGEVPMGRAPAFSLAAGQVALIHTGGMLPEGADAVVMLEYTQQARPGEIEVLRAAAPGENVLFAGEDVDSGQEILPAGKPLRPAEIGGLMALGLTHVPVSARPRVAILSSGDEVIPPEQTPMPGQVRDINSYTLSALVEAHGGIARRSSILPDISEILETTLREAIEDSDLVIITAGSSASTRDFTADCINRAGRPGVLVHGVNVKPGKPTILGICSGKPVIGLPGNPVSALVIASLFVIPTLEYLLAIPPDRPRPSIPARLAVNIPSQAGREDFIPVHLVSSPQGLTADPIFYKSNLIFTLSRADGLVHIPASATGLESGAQVQVILF
jgi:molybdopterin molybdotransferase